ncbi:MAG: oxygen-independent coproporphyrinogen III oxidase [Desulfuromonadales bacterium]
MSRFDETRLKKLFIKYSAIGPYYTSYPTGKTWSENFTEKDYRKTLVELLDQNPPISLYIHFPFCTRRCRFCFCYTTVTHDRTQISSFFTMLQKEIALFQQLLKACSMAPNIQELHLGGGSPSFMEPEEFTSLIRILKPLIDVKKLAEFTMEIDAITVTRDKLNFFAESGVNRISLGIQDFDPDVQMAIGRIQSPELIAGLLTPDIRVQFKSVNFDLMYGLPLQTRATFRATIEETIQLQPDRLAIYNYFHLPEIYPHQSSINKADLPEYTEKYMIFIEASELLNKHGYDSIGIDHFAKMTEELSIAKRNRSLCRHFMGYTAGRAPSVIGLGPSSLGGFTHYYTQNVYSTDDYAGCLNKGVFPLLRGYRLSDDDIFRREVINELFCYFSVDIKKIESVFRISFSTYFARELDLLQPLIVDGIVAVSDHAINIVPGAELFVRHVCAVFDAYDTRDSSRYVPVVQRSGKDPS